ncbi:MAG: hypothetical protein LBG87_04960 [Spirochaetaceae bacterium]|jgi:hypothetical protein|nr:hypothetical protein [Spirochaetaceae bacterium]
MKSKHGLVFGFAALLAAMVSLTFIACGGDDDDSGPSTKQLTLTVGSEYNDKYVMLSGTGTPDGGNLLGIKDLTGSSNADMQITLPKISGGKAVVPIWKVSSDGKLTEYSGSDTVTFSAAIYTDGVITYADMTDSSKIAGAGSFAVDLSKSEFDASSYIFN